MRTLLKIVLDVFTRFELNIKKLRGQCYDGASNMSGHKKGLQAKIREIEPRALFVHCNAHNLNLVVQDAISELQWTRQHIGIIREIINFVRDSPKRLAQFSGLEESNNKNLKAYCPTRLVYFVTFRHHYINLNPFVSDGPCVYHRFDQISFLSYKHPKIVPWPRRSVGFLRLWNRLIIFIF